MKRSLMIKIGTALVLIGICVWMFIVGRGHSVYFDNKTLEYNGETYPALYSIGIKVGDQDLGSYREKERGMAECMGQNINFHLEVRQEKGGEKTPYDFSQNLPYNLDGIVINLPGLLAGLPEEAYMSEFVSMAVQVEDSADEEIVTDEFELGDL